MRVRLPEDLAVPPGSLCAVVDAQQRLVVRSLLSAEEDAPLCSVPFAPPIAADADVIGRPLQPTAVQRSLVVFSVPCAAAAALAAKTNAMCDPRAVLAGPLSTAGLCCRSCGALAVAPKSAFVVRGMPSALFAELCDSWFCSHEGCHCSGGGGGGSSEVPAVFSGLAVPGEVTAVPGTAWVGSASVLLHRDDCSVSLSAPLRRTRAAGATFEVWEAPCCCRSCGKLLGESRAFVCSGASPSSPTDCELLLRRTSVVGSDLLASETAQAAVVASMFVAKRDRLCNRFVLCDTAGGGGGGGSAVRAVVLLLNPVMLLHASNFGAAGPCAGSRVLWRECRDQLVVAAIEDAEVISTDCDEVLSTLSEPVLPQELHDSTEDDSFRSMLSSAFPASLPPESFALGFLSAGMFSFLQ